MKIRIVSKGSHGGVAVVTNGPVGNALDCLKGLGENYAGSVKGFPALFKRFANQGSSSLTYEAFHKAGNDFHRFRKSKVRVYCFLDEDMHLLVLTHCSLKKQDKTSSKDKKTVKKCRRAYDRAKLSEILVIEDTSHE